MTRCLGSFPESQLAEVYEYEGADAYLFIQVFELGREETSATIHPKVMAWFLRCGVEAAIVPEGECTWHAGYGHHSVWAVLAKTPEPPINTCDNEGRFVRVSFRVVLVPLQLLRAWDSEIAIPQLEQPVREGPDGQCTNHRIARHSGSTPRSIGEDRWRSGSPADPEAHETAHG